MTEALQTGASKGHVISPADRDRMLDEYYSLHGWDARGVPTPERLKGLGLETLAANLARL
jgi:aldehyde:ferredoxin oxidoreductase